MPKNRDKRGAAKKAERQIEIAGKFPFHRIGKLFYQIVNWYRGKRGSQNWRGRI